jgi:hypothetical protein
MGGGLRQLTSRLRDGLTIDDLLHARGDRLTRRQSGGSGDLREERGECLLAMRA